MLYINDLFKACVCSFCENIYEYNSIDEKDFTKSLKLFLEEDNLQECLEICTSEVIYDIQNIENICSNFLFKNKRFELENAIPCCENAYLKTIQIDKTINVEAFVDNLTKEFNNKL